jgi:uncharacterized protein YndB with AHSA1/START domain
MAPLVPRGIDWIDEAPLRIEASSETAASPDAVFAVLADHERWPEWFTSVRDVTVLGRGEGVGARRRVKIPGATVEEEFIVWEPGVRFAFTGIDFRPRITRSIVEDCRLTPRPGGGTAITYTQYLDPPPLLRPLLTRLASRLRANNDQAMANLARRAEERGTS